MNIPPQFYSFPLPIFLSLSLWLSLPLFLVTSSPSSQSPESHKAPRQEEEQFPESSLQTSSLRLKKATHLCQRMATDESPCCCRRFVYLFLYLFFITARTLWCFRHWCSKSGVKCFSTPRKTRFVLSLRWILPLRFNLERLY